MSLNAPTGDDSTTTDELIDRAVPDGLGDVTRLVVPTDDTDSALGRARRVALQIARATDAEVVLYDRSDERWTDTPHPSGPFAVDQVDGERRPHLVRQMREFVDAGVTTTAWLATVPALTAMLDVLQDLEVDVVVVPDRLDAPRMMDRLQVGSTPAEMVERIARLQLPRTPALVSVADDGVARIVTSTAGATTTENTTPQEDPR